MKVLEMITDTNIGGAGVLLLGRLKVTDRQAFETVVALPEKSMLLPEIKKVGVRTVGIRGCEDTSASFSGVFSCLKVIWKEKPDLINCHGCLSGRLAAAVLGVPVRIYTKHCVFPLKTSQKLWMYRWLNRLGNQCLSHKIIAVAQAAKENLVATGVLPGQIEVIVNGVEGFHRQSAEKREKTRAEYGIPCDATVVAICARLEPYKDHLCFLRAAEYLVGHPKPYRFLIIGDGSMRQELELFCRKKGIADKVIFTGFTRETETLMNIVDINVNCSIGTETSSLALSEGMSLGIPAIVSDFGGNPYMVSDGVNGLVYPQGDAKALSQCIMHLANSPQMYDAMSYHARKRFESELNVRNMTRRTESLYREQYQNRKQNHSPRSSMAN